MEKESALLLFRKVSPNGNSAFKKGIVPHKIEKTAGDIDKYYGNKKQFSIQEGL